MNEPAAPGGAAPIVNAPGGAAPVTAWHHADHAPLVTAKAWKGADDVLRDYANLEKHVGVPADQLIRLPAADKIDDTFRQDVLKRIGYAPPAPPGAPAKIEDYGVTLPDGTDPAYMNGLLAEAQKLGITKEQMQGLAAINAKFAGDHMAGLAQTEKDAAAADEAMFNTRRGAVDAKLKERFGAKYDESQELMLREAVRLGYTPDELKAVQKSLALGGENDLLRFETMLADLAEVRREAPFHKDGNVATMSKEQAASMLKSKGADPKWAKAALTRGTPEAVENLRLNAIASGKVPNEAEIERIAKGLAPTAQS